MGNLFSSEETPKEEFVIIEKPRPKHPPRSPHPVRENRKEKRKRLKKEFKSRNAFYVPPKYI